MMSDDIEGLANQLPHLVTCTPNTGTSGMNIAAVLFVPTVTSPKHPP